MAHVIAILATIAALADAGTAQDGSASGPLANELKRLMQKGKIECLAAAETGSPDRFVAALYFPTQLLVVSARYAAPSLLRERVLAHDYRGVYEQLQGAGEREGKFFVLDLGVDGLHLRPLASRALDVIYQSVDVRTAFDGDWAKQGLTEQQYRERFRAADEQYAQLLTVLAAQGKADSARN